MTDTEYPTVVLKSRSEQLVEARFGGRDIAEILRDLYHGDRHLTQAQIADELGVTRPTVVDWMKRYDIPTGYNRAEAV
jgi:DNA-binding MarR family transcriptional regulator